MNAVNTWFRELLTFTGRATRFEMAGHLIAYFLIGLPVALMDAILAVRNPGVAPGLVIAIYLVLIFTPLLALSVRRLHDMNCSGLLVLISFVPLVGLIVTLGQLFVPGTRGENEYGADPRGPVDTPRPPAQHSAQIPQELPKTIADEPLQVDRAEPMIIVTTLAKSFDFDGRASRSEYWPFFILCLFIALLSLGLDYTMGWYRPGEGMGPTCLLFAVLSFLPSLAVSVRRLHDSDKSGWLCLVNFIPVVGPLFMLGFMAVPGTEGSNQYGAAPKPVSDFPEALDADSGKQP